MDTKTLSVARIVGSASQEHWSQVSVFPQTNIRLGTSKESLFLCLSIKSKADDEVTVLGKEIIERVRSEYFEFGEGELETKLLGCVDNVISEFSEYELSLVVGVAKGGELAFASVGEAGALMLREGNLGWVTQKSTDSTPVLALGSWRPGDLIVMGTKQFFAGLDADQLREVFGKPGASDAGEYLASIIHAQDTSEGMASLVLEITDLTGEEVGLTEVEDQGEEVKGSLMDKLSGGFLGKTAETFGAKRREWLGLLRRGRGEARPNVYLKSANKKKVTISVALVLMVLLALSVGLGWRKRAADETNRRFLEIYEPARFKYDDALKLVESNPLRARVLLAEVQSDVEPKITQFNEGTSERERLEGLVEDSKNKYQEVAGENVIEEAKDFFNLSLVRDDFFGEKFEFEDGVLAIMDSSHGVVAQVTVENKQSGVAGGGDLLRGVKLLGATVGRAVALTNEGIVSIWYTSREPEVLVEPEEDWGNLKAIGTYGGNVYLVDGGTSELWRYPGFEGGVGDRRRWLGPGVVPDFSSVVDIAIDGDVWVLDRDGTISLYRQGAPVNFNVSGLVAEISDAVAIDTEIESENIYVLDRSNSRVLVIGKNGDYKEQYEWAGISGVSDMAVVESLGKILLLSGSNIYEIELTGQ